MKKPKIVILDGGYASYHAEETLLTEKGYHCTHYSGPGDDHREKTAFCRDAVGVLVRGTLIDDAFFQSCPDLRVVVRYGVGYDNIDIEAATHHGVKVANVQGYANHSVSDHALALMYACMRMLPMGIGRIKSGFGKPPVPDLFELHEKTVGIIGLGRIGRTFCRKIGPLCNRVLACDPAIDHQVFDEYGAIRVELNELLAESDVISLHCDLNESSQHLLDRQAFMSMGKRPIVINTSRGGVIDTHALLGALETDRIHSAGIDVFEHEPLTLTEVPLLGHPRIISTGHYAWYSDRAAIMLQKRAVENLVNLLEGKRIEDCLNP